MRHSSFHQNLESTILYQIISDNLPLQEKICQIFYIHYVLSLTKFQQRQQTNYSSTANYKHKPLKIIFNIHRISHNILQTYKQQMQQQQQKAVS